MQKEPEVNNAQERAFKQKRLSLLIFSTFSFLCLFGLVLSGMWKHGVQQHTIYPGVDSFVTPIASYAFVFDFMHRYGGYALVLALFGSGYSCWLLSKSLVHTKKVRSLKFLGWLIMLLGSSTAFLSQATGKIWRDDLNSQEISLSLKEEALSRSSLAHFSEISPFEREGWNFAKEAHLKQAPILLAFTSLCLCLALVLVPKNRLEGHKKADQEPDKKEPKKKEEERKP